VEDGSPDTDPCGKGWIDGRIILSDNVEDGVVEEGDKTSDAHNGERLASEEAEDHCC